MVRGNLPTGTVTMLFTDVEGSTRLLRQHGPAYADLLEAHRQALRKVFEAHGGVEVDKLAELLAIFTNGTRLITITGPGGTGKTRLALALAAEFVGSLEDGVWAEGRTLAFDDAVELALTP